MGRGSGIRFTGNTALVVVDVQNDFADPKGSLYVPGGEDVLESANALISRAKRQGCRVVYTQDWHPADTPHFAKGGGTWPVHCVADTWGAEFAPDLVVEGAVVRKGTSGEDGYSGFSALDLVSGSTRPTKLAALLDEVSAGRVVVCGLATDYCVKETALDALRHGYEVVVDTKAIRPVDLEPGDGERALAAMVGAGASVV